MAEAAKKEPNVLLEIGKAILGPGYRPGQSAAMGRELVKDLQQTFHEVAYGKSMHSPEPGTNALNPTAQLITEELKGREVDGKTDELTAPQATVHGHSTLDKIRGGVFGNNEPAKAPEQQKDHGIER